MNKISKFSMKTELILLIFFSLLPQAAFQHCIHICLWKHHKKKQHPASHSFKSSSIPCWGGAVFNRNNNTMFYLKASLQVHCSPSLPQPQILHVCCVPDLRSHMWAHFTSHQILFLIFYFPYFMLFSFHLLTPSFGHRGCWQIKWTVWVYSVVHISQCRDYPI